MNSDLRHDLRDNGKFVSEISDDELWELYEQHGTSKKVAKACGRAESTIRSRLLKIRKAKGHGVEELNIDVAGAMERLINAVPLTAPGGGVLDSIDTSLWEVGAKDELSGEIVKRGLDKIGARYKFGGKGSLVVEPFDSPLVSYIPTGMRPDNCERVFIIGDVQCGFWSVLDPSDPTCQKFVFEPFHDLRAIDVMLQAMALFNPTRVVIVGDYFDFPQLSRFQQEPQWAQTMQATIQYGYDLLVKIRQTVGYDCDIDFIPGNHETRMQRAIVNNNPALMNLRRPGEKWPIYSIPSLMKFEQLHIECAAEFPSGEVWLAPRRGNTPGLVVTHADPKKRDTRADSIHGHLVLPGKWTTNTIYEQDGPVTFERMCVSGCGNYSDTSDKLRLTRTNTPSGRARMSSVQSFGYVEIDKESGLRTMDYVKIIDGTAKFMGQIIQSEIDTEIKEAA